MREKPILFSGAMVRALLADTKSQTRRAIKPQPDARCTEAFLGADGVWRFSYPTAAAPVSHADCDVRCPYGVPGDRLYVRECFSGPWDYEEAKWPPSAWFSDDPIWYWADGNPENGDWTKPRPSIHMPRWASRILLEVTEVRVQRLWEISPGDSISEGIGFEVRFGGHCLPDGSHFHATDPRQSYFSLWESINGAGSVERNDWVWALSFRRVQP